MAYTFQILAIFCVFVLFNTAECRRCYECTASEPSHTCATHPPSTTEKECGLLHKCLVTKVTTSGNFTELTRKCALPVWSFDGKTKCTTTANRMTCQIVCDTDLCNSISQNAVYQYVVNYPANSVTSGSRMCYECAAFAPSDSCATNPPTTAEKKCGQLDTKCLVTKVTDSTSGNLAKLTRKCADMILGKTECTTTGSTKICQIVCDTDLCNSVSQNAVDQYVAAHTTHPVASGSRMCYECTAFASSDSCATNPPTTTEKKCGLLDTKCLVTKVTDSTSGNLTELTRKCADMMGKSECITAGSTTTCQIVCDTDLCNSVSENAVFQYIAANSVTSGNRKCYVCEGIVPTDSCARQPPVSTEHECLPLETCVMTQITTLGILTSVSRNCSVDLTGSTKCISVGAKRTCHIRCDTDLCNSVPQDEVDKYIAEN